MLSYISKFLENHFHENFSQVQPIGMWKAFFFPYLKIDTGIIEYTYRKADPQNVHYTSTH